MSIPVMHQRPIRVIFHCADTPDYDRSSPNFDKFGASDIKSWHLTRGFNDIGYHWIIRRTGVIEKGREENVIGAHCEGHNSGSIGVCYMGREHMTEEQKAALDFLFLDILNRWGIPSTQWFGHRFFTSKKMCPGFDVETDLRPHFNELQKKPVA